MLGVLRFLENQKEILYSNNLINRY